MTRHPIGDGSIYAVLSDPVRAVTGAGVRAFADEHGKVSFDPDVMALPPHIVNADGQWDVPSTLALLWEVVRVQARQIDALTRIVPHMDSPPAPPAPEPPSGPRHAAPPDWSASTPPGGIPWPDATSPTRSHPPAPGAPSPPRPSPPLASSPAPSR